jgi:hypothetical protein
MPLSTPDLVAEAAADNLVVLDDHRPSRLRKAGSLAAAIVAAVALGWGALVLAQTVIVDRIELKLNTSGISAQMTITAGLWPTLHLDDVRTTIPFSLNGFTLQGEVPRIDIPIDVPGGLMFGEWLPRPILIRDAHLSVSPAEEMTTERVEGRATGSRALSRVREICADYCGIELDNVAVDLAVPGVEYAGWTRLHGILSVKDLHDLKFDIRDERDSRILVEADLDSWRENHKFVLTGKQDVTVQPARLPEAIRERVREPIRVRLSGVTVARGEVRLRRLETEFALELERELSVFAEDVAITMGPHGWHPTAASAKGLSVAATDPVRGFARFEAASATLRDDESLLVCASDDSCATHFTGVRMAWSPGDETNPAVEITVQELARCGDRCIEADGATLDAERDGIRLSAAWREVRGSVAMNFGEPTFLRVAGGYVHLDHPTPTESNGEPVCFSEGDTSRFREIRDAITALRADPTRLRNGLISPDSPATGELARAVAHVLDHTIQGGLARFWHHGDETVSRLPGHGPALEVEDGTLSVSLEGLPRINAVVQALRVETRSHRIDLDVAGTLDMPESLRFDWDTTLTSHELGRRGVWTGDEPLEARLSATLHRSGTWEGTVEGKTPTLHMFHKSVASERIEVAPLTFTAAFNREQDQTEVRWNLPRLDLAASAGAHVEIDGSWTLAQKKRNSRARVSLRLPKQDCGALYRSIPSTMLYGLHGARFSGEASLGLSLDVPLHMVAALNFDATADLSTCVAEELGEGVDIAKLMDPKAIFQVHDHRLRRTFDVGQGTANWTNFSALPSHVWAAAMATEDFGFFGHEGFSPGFIERALRLNLRVRRYAYGGSTITQQLVKNLFLTRQKTLARKLVEAVLVWQVERHVPKRRILSLYLNCIEYGPYIYGIRAAARRYFRTEPWGLRPVESAFIMNIKPAPWAGYWIFKKRIISDFFINRALVIRRRLLRAGYINAAEAETLDASNLYARFDMDEQKEKLF